MIFSFVGPTGSGKTTIANKVAIHFDAQIIKIAAPIHELQSHFYNRLGIPVNSQDGELLQYYAAKIERQSPGWLAKEFIKEVDRSTQKIILNDDCRLNAYRHLSQHEIVFVRIITDVDTRKKRLRNDHINLDPNHETEQGFEHIDCQYVIDNNGLIETSVRKAIELIDGLIENIKESTQEVL